MASPTASSPSLVYAYDDCAEYGEENISVIIADGSSFKIMELVLELFGSLSFETAATKRTLSRLVGPP
jgi:hypothetical protein